MCDLTTSVLSFFWELWISQLALQYSSYYTLNLLLSHKVVLTKYKLSSQIILSNIKLPSFIIVWLSLLGAVPKKHTDNKWMLILNLSHPKGATSMMALTRTCEHESNDVVQEVLRLGRGTLLAKIDFESAFRKVPVHSEDIHLLGMVWRDRLYVGTILPFRLRSAPKIFNALVDGLQYLEHFLDDYTSL